MKKNRNNKLIIFGRYPEPGKVKTRLIPAIGPYMAADLQRRLTENVIDIARGMLDGPGNNIEFCFSGGSRRKLKKWLGSDLTFTRQAPGDLGEKMYGAFASGFDQGYSKILLIGTDIPDIETPHLEKAFEAFKHSEIVLGPSTDGGYWLVGMKKLHNIFDAIPWSTEKVLEKTLGSAEKLGLTTVLVDTMSDIDTEEDLRCWRPEEAAKRPYISIIVPTLNEADGIGDTIQNALRKETEILVVDGGSEDNTQEIAQKYGARVFSGEKGRSLQQNSGASKAEGNVLLFLHADTLLPDQFAKSIFEIMLEKGVVAGAFRFKTDSESKIMGIIEFFTNIRSLLFQLPYGDQALFIPRQVFKSAGGFPQVPLCEDLLLMQKLKKSGRVKIASASILTSARRWKRHGILKSTLINYLIAAGCLAGISPERFADLYNYPDKILKYLQGFDP